MASSEFTHNARVTEANITDEELRFIIGPKQLQKQAPYSLAHRCKLFHRQFPSRRIKVPLMRKLLRQAGIKKKAIITRRCCANTSSKRREKDRTDLLALADRMEEYYRQERHILYIDECVFTARGY